RARPTVTSGLATRSGGDDEDALRFFEGEKEPLRTTAEAADHDSARRADDRVLQVARYGPRHAVPGPDQPLPAGLRRNPSSSGDPVEAGGVMSRRKATFAGGREGPSPAGTLSSGGGGNRNTLGKIAEAPLLQRLISRPALTALPDGALKLAHF